MKTQLWTDIINSNELAPQDGIYLFMCRGDMHLLTELHWLNKGERLYKYYEGEYQHDNVWARVWPIAFHIVPAYQENGTNPFWTPYTEPQRGAGRKVVRILSFRSTNTPQEQRPYIVDGGNGLYYCLADTLDFFNPGSFGEIVNNPNVQILRVYTVSSYLK